MELSPFVQKMAWTILAALCIVGGALLRDVTAKVALFSLASGISSAVWVPRPGDVKLDDVAPKADK